MNPVTRVWHYWFPPPPPPRRFETCLICHLAVPIWRQFADGTVRCVSCSDEAA